MWHFDFFSPLSLPPPLTFHISVDFQVYPGSSVAKE